MSSDSLGTLLAFSFCVGLPFFFITTVALCGILFAYWRRSKHIKQDLTRRLESLEQQHRLLTQDAELVSRNEWLRSIVDTTYRNEVEVEIKFIYPLMQFLGYEDKELQVRVPVAVQVGRQQVAAEADWLVTDSQQGRPTIVIEAKEPNQQLNGAVCEQARSYAYGLKVPTYMITNGNRLQIYQRGVVDDQCVVDCTMQELASSWDIIEQAIGRPRG